MEITFTRNRQRTRNSANKMRSKDSLKCEIPDAEIINVDLDDWNATRKGLKNVEHVDGLVNNAVVVILASFFEIKPNDFDKMFSINVKSIINVSQIVAGTIVNISSKASVAAVKDHTAYCGSKSALDALTRNMVFELGPYQIRVNSVNPTVIMTERSKLGWSDPAEAKPMLDKIPLGRFGEVSEVVNAVLYLLSDKSTMINGVALPIDGGFLATS